ncbi:MAG TPA: hypothetical protein VFN92_04365 [Solirubrobacterales bacterium]|nr:hypothetical protein [Solirubrobacterales bacterium]
MSDDPTPINARPKRQPPEAIEDLSLALRDRVLWPLGDRFLGLDDAARAAVAGGAVALALAIGIGGYSLASSGGDPATAPTVALKSEPVPAPSAPAPSPKPAPDPTLQGAAPVFKASEPDESAKVDGSRAVESDAAAASAATANSGNPATDTISSSPAATAAAATASGASVEGPPAGPAAVAVARKFADAFVVYETGGDTATVRRAFKATAAPPVTRALLQRPPHQPAGVDVPEAKVLNVVPAPSHDRIYPVSVSLLRVGATSELRLEMEQLKNEQWRVVNVLG